MKYYTHSGLFHCDEVAGYAICVAAGICDQSERLTDIINLPNDGIIADIGMEYNPEKNRFDHHQGFLVRENGYPLASAGLLWKHFGYQCVADEIIESDCDFIKAVVDRVDLTLIQGIDAHDSDNNYSLPATCSAGKVRAYSLPNIISSFNGTDTRDNEAQHERFEKAAGFFYNILAKEIQMAKEHVGAEKVFDSVAEIEGEIIILPQNMMWKEIVHEKHPNAKFVISPSLHPGNPFSMVAVPVEPESREVKIPIERPKWFDGFIHQGKWIAGADSIQKLKRLAEFNLK